MNEIKLSKRLQAVADLVKPNSRLLDVGSDHAYLPTYLVQQEKIDFAIAGEVVKGPYQIARNHVAEQNLQENIEVRLADGLAAFEENDAITSVVIAGMGGILISEILEAGKDKLSQVEQLILQPNNHEESLRSWLMDHDFVITFEKILLEAGKIYEIIVAEHGTTELNETELEFGPYLSQEKSEVFRQKWNKELNTLNKILERLPENHEKRTKVQAEKEKIEGVLL
ncbi:tRNA (adenine(22)-N(1))-methyltransferase [Lactococcus formosensis]|jgi:tRNA (adenine22-N1)-methyltransferase|uniref:tRNA (Adenine(22)-N(1))-methyltransferase TrmK n=1 Tax=Lactococcus formosensis TaxID=1281486 RepID=A0A9Q8Y4Y1_9LACT|nr:tRNA (adenine(22)-N(1))-methyltransferase TrmK [Lactococcus formosensis]MCH1723418.1 tRNA (adenine(22)-N(1))-methyltransferase TrmK [Lactococcus formosensis]MDG6126618.1 tRNA (adenine(22)-N(1))-methyltransferase TrmK [Lactococcus formosensis]MDG6131694.1 tRNA (adenine(22)-N(1))-methyltransferase TrmK [Lactococcus formosensis]MDG6133692.1 tRNA (adenine(22)-N(1))-methyltransferase TrmK [Lactococcus formosensis]MDG6140682.1 tRNA (adenine(22)-N(1))-methyltransferase TrmK [Lactococcus formosensi